MAENACSARFAATTIALLVATALTSCEGRQQQATQTGGPAPANSGAKPTGDVAAQGSGDKQAEGQNGEVQPAEDAFQSVLSKEELEKGKAFINNWDGLNDDIPSTVAWTMLNVSVTGAPPAGTPSGGASTTPSATVTYDGDIKSLLTTNCVNCHRVGGERASSPMTTYAEAKQLGASLVSRVVAGTMPPNSAGLPQAQKDKFTAWQKSTFAEKAITGTTPTPPPSGGTTPGGGTTAGGNVEFRIKRGTGSGAWNTKATEVVVPMGKTLTIYNDDDMVHQMHTNDAPCPHGNEIEPGGSAICQARQQFSGEPPLYDHGTEGKFYIRTE